MNRLNNCLENKKYTGIPVWFMRQAGRYLPEFIEIRKKNLDFLKLCFNQDLSTQISLQPLKRFDLDAVILFSDILVIPFGLGQNIIFEKGFGPKLEKINLEKIINTDKKDFLNKVSSVYEIIKNIKKEINTNKKSIIGFVGAPWTLLLYMLNQQSPKRNFEIEKIIKDQGLVKNLLKKLEEIICLHIEKQIEAGATVIQIFDSWAGLLPKKELSRYCFEPNLNIVNFVKSKKIPIICFPRDIGEEYLEFSNIVKPSCLSIDYNIDPKWAVNNFNNLPIQGGLDPKILLTDNENIKKNVEKYLEVFKDYPYIFNLGHGVLPETKPKTISAIVEIVRNYEK